MDFHAVRVNPSKGRAITRRFTLAFAIAVSAQLAQAATLGVINNVNRSAGEITISGIVYKTGSTTEVTQSNADGGDEIAALYALKPGQYVEFETRDGRVTSISLPDPGAVDLPAGSPIAPARITPAER